jgi:hypothetical protein
LGSPDGPRWCAVARTIRAFTKSVRVSSFLRGLLAKSVRLTWEPIYNGSRPPLYIDGLRPIKPPHLIKSIVLIVLTLCIRSSSSLALV